MKNIRAWWRRLWCVHVDQYGNTISYYRFFVNRGFFIEGKADFRCSKCGLEKTITDYHGRKAQ